MDHACTLWFLPPARLYVCDMHINKAGTVCIHSTHTACLSQYMHHTCVLHMRASQGCFRSLCACACICCFCRTPLDQRPVVMNRHTLTVTSVLVTHQVNRPA